MDIHDFQARHALHFDDLTLLEQALTHRSFLNEQEDESLRHNERLEFLGDAVLDFIVARVLFLRYPDMPEGDLTRLRSALVRTQTLAEIARKLDLGAYLRMSKGEDMSGGRDRRALLCDAFEGLVGALYLDQGIDVVSNFVTPLLMPLVDHILAEGLHIDARSKLQEWSQSFQGETPIYVVIDEAGPDHEKEFTMEVMIGEQVVGTGTGRSKQLAAQAAARNALHSLESEANEESSV